jgi:hypothetical protein
MTTTDTQAAKGTKPTHYAYHISEGSEKNYWTRIGAVWPHKDGNGFSLQLDCVPLDRKVTLRLASETK